MRIAQLSDIHISGNDESLDDIDVRGNFVAVLSEVRNAGYDLLVLSGDLAAKQADEDIYGWIRQQISELSIPVLVMAGNHDESRSVAECFDLNSSLGSDCLVERRAFPGVTVYSLDTSTEHLPPSQIEWLERSLAAERSTPIVFMHHPPLGCDCAFMDVHAPLLDREEAWRSLASIEELTHIFCGHYHTHKVVTKDDIEVVLCPSTMMQISERHARFRVANRRPGYLEITIDGKQIRWKAHYLAEPSVEPTRA